MAKLCDIDLTSLKLSAIESAGSGACMLFETIPPNIQTPWLVVNQFARNEYNKSTLLLEPGLVASWVQSVEDVVKSQLGNLADNFVSSLTPNGWKFNLPASAAVFGSVEQDTTQAAVLFQLTGCWFWREMVGLKVKVLQVKGLPLSQGNLHCTFQGEGPGSRLLPGHINGRSGASNVVT